MTDSDPPARLGSTSGVPLAKVSVLIDQKLHGLFSDLRLEQPREADVTADIVSLIDSAQSRCGQKRILMYQLHHGHLFNRLIVIKSR